MGLHGTREGSAPPDPPDNWGAPPDSPEGPCPGLGPGMHEQGGQAPPHRLGEGGGGGDPARGPGAPWGPGGPLARVAVAVTPPWPRVRPAMGPSGEPERF